MLAVEPPETLRRAAEAAAADGQSATYLVEGDKVLAVFAIADAIRPESFDAVKRLHASGLEVVLLTGDSTAVANAVAKELNIDTVFAEVLPEDKVRSEEHTSELQSLMRISYAVFCLQKKKNKIQN